MAKAIQAVWIDTDYYNTIDVNELVRVGITDVFVKANRVDSPLASTVLPVVLSDFEDTNINVHAWVKCFVGVQPDDSATRAAVLSFCETLATESLPGGDYEGLYGIHLGSLGYDGDE